FEPAHQFVLEALEPEFALLFAVHIAEHRNAFAELFIADDDHVAGAQLVRPAHLTLEAFSLAFHLDANAAQAQPVGGWKRPCAPGVADPDEKQRRPRRLP